MPRIRLQEEKPSSSEEGSTKTRMRSSSDSTCHDRADLLWDAWDTYCILSHPSEQTPLLLHGSDAFVKTQKALTFSKSAIGRKDQPTSAARVRRQSPSKSFSPQQCQNPNGGVDVEPHDWPHVAAFCWSMYDTHVRNA